MKILKIKIHLQNSLVQNWLFSSKIALLQAGLHVMLRLGNPLVFAAPFLIIETLSINTVTCCHATHSRCLTQTQTLGVK